MKKFRIFLLVATVACLTVGCNRPQKFTVQGTLKDIKFPKADSVRLESELLAKPIFAPVEDKAFVLNGKVKKPTIGKVFAIGSYKRQAKFMILEKGTITFKNGYAYGTPLNDSTAAFSERLRSMKNKYPNPEDMELLRQSVEDEFFAFVARHKNDPCAVYAILLAHKRLENDKLLKLIQSTSPEIQLDGDVHAIKASLTKGK